MTPQVAHPDTDLQALVTRVCARALRRPTHARSLLHALSPQLAVSLRLLSDLPWIPLNSNLSHSKIPANPLYGDVAEATTLAYAICCS